MKRLSRIADYLMTTGAWFWAIETAYFLFVHGWHYRAINEAEKICDELASLMMVAGLAIYIYLATRVIKTIIDEI